MNHHITSSIQRSRLSSTVCLCQMVEIRGFWLSYCGQKWLVLLAFQRYLLIRMNSINCYLNHIIEENYLPTPLEFAISGSGDYPAYYIGRGYKDPGISYYSANAVYNVRHSQTSLLHKYCQLIFVILEN